MGVASRFETPLYNLTSYLALEQSGTQPGTQGSTDYQIRATMETGSMVFTPTQGPVTSTLLAKPSNKFSQVRSLLNKIKSTTRIMVFFFVGKSSVILV